MKKFNLLKYAVALCLSAFCLMFLPISAGAEEIRDEKNGVTYPNEIYITSGIAMEGCHGGAGYIQIRLDNEGDRIKNVKSKSKKLLAQITEENYEKRVKNNKTVFHYTRTSISFFGKKKGTYKVTFDVVDASGKKKCTKTVKVFVDKYATYTSPIKSVKYAGKDISLHGPYTKVAKGKFKVTVRKGYKVTAINVKKRNAQGDWVSTKVRNGKKITLSKREKYTRKDEWSSLSVNALFPETQIEVSVKNKKTKEVTIYIYSLYTMNKK